MHSNPLKAFTRLLMAVLGVGAGAMITVGLLAGCSHYSLGATGKLDFNSLYVAPVQNRSYAAQVQAPMTDMIRQSLLQEANLQLTDQGDAQATLEVTLTNYQRDTAATQQGNSLNAQSYTLTLEATCSLVDNRTGKYYFKDRKIETTEEAFIENGDSFAESEFQAIPKLSRDLSQKIKNAVVSTW